jgi:hypothetical protein
MSYKYNCIPSPLRHELEEPKMGAIGFKRSKVERRASFGPTTILSDDDAMSQSMTSDIPLGSMSSRQQRNRDKAREGRVQKKECVKQLQARIRSLENERKLQLEQEELDAEANEQRSNIRKAVLKNFMSGLTKTPGKENNDKMWSCLVEPSFWLKQPVTLFRGFNKAEIQPGPCRISRCVSGLLAEAASLSVMIENIGSDNDRWMAAKYSQVMLPPRSCTPENSLQGDAVYQVPSTVPNTTHHIPAGAPFSFDPISVLGTNYTGSGEGAMTPDVTACFEVCEDHMIFSGDVLMCSYTFRSQNAVLAGACSDISLRGIARAQFSPHTNKLQNIEFMYDSMGLMQQLVNASGRDSCVSPVVVPHNLEMALTPNAQEARVLTLASPPFSVIHVNEAWTNMTQFSQLDVEGNSLVALNTLNNDPPHAHNNQAVTNAINTGIREKDLSRVARGQCVHNASKYRNRQGNCLVASVSSYPLAKDNGRIEHILHVFKKLEDVSAPTLHIPGHFLPTSISIPIRCPSGNDAESEKQHQDEMSYTDTLSNFFDGGATCSKSVVSAAPSSSSISSGSTSSRGKRKLYDRR